jgi:hypothetical protein
MSVTTLDDFFRETGEVRIKIPARPRPKLAKLQERFSRINGLDIIDRDTSPTEAVTFTLGTVLRRHENRISGHEYEKRIGKKLESKKILGLQQADWLFENQQEIPDLMDLPDRIYIDFLGLVVADRFGVRSYPYLERKGNAERFDLGWDWLFSNLVPDGRIAVSSKRR